ncbi:MAG: hypothetical protein HOH74_24550 [Gemmatimonadetes bacterium]|nr:hypothetical protein [Gemmatimonadota bacterium]MBT6148628.1 hypothetical protein [Gemmatimonadota bacterium]
MREPGMSAEQVQQFTEEGWVMVPDVFEDADIQPVRDEITEVIDAGARQLVAEGKLEHTFADEPFETRLTRIHEHCDEIMRPIVGKGGGGHSGPAFFRFITHPSILAHVQSLVGEEIIGSSVYRIRPKMPNYERGAVPWHQDSGYFSPHCDGDLIVTCWIPLVDTDADNGCLQVLSQGHRSGVVPHFTGGQGGFLEIVDDDLPNRLHPLTVPVPAGGVLFMTNLTPHRSTYHTKDIVRWATDVRYQASTVPNNVGELPGDYDAERPTHEIACYPPEADFVVQSPTHPERVVGAWEEFNKLRQRFEGDGRPPGPKRGWEPIAAS